MRVLTLDATHLEVYRALMLEAYERSADAFTTTATERKAPADPAAPADGAAASGAGGAS